MLASGVHQHNNLHRHKKSEDSEEKKKPVHGTSVNCETIEGPPSYANYFMFSLFINWLITVYID